MLPYYSLQHYQLFPVTVMPATFIDRLIPFSPPAVWPYLSIYLFMPIAPFLMNQRQQLLRYAIGVMMIEFVASSIFLLWPTSCERPAIEIVNPLYRLLIRIDAPVHAFPSLHAAFAVYSALCCELILPLLPIERSYLRTVSWLWTLLILYAALATKQHVLADLLAGSALGIFAFFIAFKLSIPLPKWAFVRTVTVTSTHTNSTTS